MTELELIRSGRKTIAICVNPDGRVVVRAPYGASQTQIQGFLNEKESWIKTVQNRMKEREENRETIVLSRQEERIWREKARSDLAARCARFSRSMGVSFQGIRINGAKTRWGSCSSRGFLNFTWRLMFLPEELIDYIVVHELSHRREMNHSPRFWRVVEETLPDYRQRRQALREFSRRIAIKSEADRS